MTAQQRTVTFLTADQVRLAGTLMSPGDGVWPAVLIINGSGPLDRDSAMKGQALGFGSSLAEELAKVGVASLRFDKRGVAESEGDYLPTGLDTETEDAAAALDALAAAPEVDADRVGLVGHSVGALISVRLAADDPTVGAVVMLAGPAQDGRTVTAWQGARLTSSLPGPSWLLPKVALAVHGYGLRKLERSTDNVVRLPIERQPAKWMREFMAYDPEPDLRRIECPLLAITGRKDLQVDPDDVARIGSLVGGCFTGETPNNLTHVLRQEPGPAGILSYGSQLKRPVDEQLLQRVSRWVAAQLNQPAS